MKIILSTEDSFSYNNGMMFTTKDSDNDRWRGNCAASFGNGWWFFECHVSNLNGVYYKKPKIAENAMAWQRWGSKSTSESLKSSKMMLRS